jgi:hypothetical protein
MLLPRVDQRVLSSRQHPCLHRRRSRNRMVKKHLDQQRDLPRLLSSHTSRHHQQCHNVTTNRLDGVKLDQQSFWVYE